MQFAHDISARATYSFHDATFEDYLTEFDGVPTQLAGKRLEMSARHLASAGVLRAPARGVLAGVEVGYVGSRYLNKRNTALADGYGTFGIMAGWRAPRWEVRLDGRNLTDERPPISESELGESRTTDCPPERLTSRSRRDSDRRQGALEHAQAFVQNVERRRQRHQEPDDVAVRPRRKQ